MKRTEVFEKELSFIGNEDVRKFTASVLETLPDYFFKVPASSTGKYHPDYALGEGGLVRHTKAAVGIAFELFKIVELYDVEKDIALSALILHDGLKHGKEGGTYTVHEHPALMAQYITENEILFEAPPPGVLASIASCICCHMGKWTTSKSKYSKVVLPEPKTSVEDLVHMCDYLASRKCIEFNFKV